jgi:hypothetical protein
MSSHGSRVSGLLLSRDAYEIKEACNHVTLGQAKIGSFHLDFVACDPPAVLWRSHGP